MRGASAISFVWWVGIALGLFACEEGDPEPRPTEAVEPPGRPAATERERAPSPEPRAPAEGDDGDPQRDEVDPPSNAAEGPAVTVTPMDERAFLRLFHSVEHDRGRRYVRARDALVREGDRARPYLERYRDDPDPGRAQAAQVVLGWMDHAEAYQRCTDLLFNRVEFWGSRPDELEIRVREMQPLVIPRLIELLLKTDEIPYDEPEYHVMRRATTFDRRFAEALATIVEDNTRSTTERLDAADELQRTYSDPRWMELVVAVAWNHAAAFDARMTAFGMLAEGHRTEHVPRILAALRDPDTSERELRAYVFAAGAFREGSAVDDVLRILRRARSSALRTEALEALAQLGDPRAIPDVERVLASETDAAIRMQARGTLDTLHSEVAAAERARRAREGD